MSYQHKVQYYETDRMGITHHSNYIRIMEEARGEWMEQMGMSYETFEGLGLVSPVVNVSCSYKKTTTYNDIITVTIYIIDCDHLKMDWPMTCACRAKPLPQPPACIAFWRMAQSLSASRNVSRRCMQHTKPTKPSKGQFPVRWVEKSRKSLHT